MDDCNVAHSRRSGCRDDRQHRCTAGVRRDAPKEDGKGSISNQSTELDGRKPSLGLTRRREVEDLPHRTRPPAYPVLNSFSSSTASSRPELTEKRTTSDQLANQKRTRSEPVVVPSRTRDRCWRRARLHKLWAHARTAAAKDREFDASDCSAELLYVGECQS